MNGTVIEHDGGAYQVVLTYAATAAGRLLPVMAVRTGEDGVMVVGFDSLTAFMLDAPAAAAGRVAVIARRSVTDPADLARFAASVKGAD